MRDLRQHHRGLEHFGDLVREAEPFERGERDHDRVEALVHLLAQPGLDVAAQRREAEIGPRVRELRAPAHRAGADHAAVGHVRESGADQRVTRVGPFGDRREDQPVGGGRGQVLGRVHGDVGATVEHGLLHFLHEHTLSADAVDLGGLVGVTVRLDEHVLDRVTEERTHPFGLPAREPAAARRDAHRALAQSATGRSNRAPSASA